MDKSNIKKYLLGFFMYFCIPYLTVFWVWYKKKWTQIKRIAFSVWAVIALIIVVSTQVQAASDLKTSESNYQKAVTAFSQKNWNDAANYFQEVISRDPNYKDAQNKLKQIADEKTKEDALKSSAKSFQDGMTLFDQKDYAKAETELEKVIKEDPNYSKATDKLKEIGVIKASALLASGKAKLAQNDFTGARVDLNSALTYNPDLTEAKTVLAQVDAKEKVVQEQQKQAEIANYKASCQTIAYKVLNKNPDSLAGQRIKLRGEILQIQEENGITVMLLQVTNLGYDMWTDNVSIIYPDKIDVYEKDKVTIWGEVKGAFSYKSVAGWDITVPQVTAKYAAKGLQ